MIDYFKKKILNKSDSYNFYKNSYNKLVEINRKNTLLLRENQFQIEHKNQKITKLKKLNDKLCYLESENTNLNSRITEYDKINNMINNVESQNKQLNNLIKSLESENTNLNSKITEYDAIKEKISNLENQNKQLKDIITTMNKQNEMLLNDNKDLLEKIQYLKKQAEYNNINLYSKYDKSEFLLTNNNSQLLRTIQYNNKQYLMSIVIPVYNSQNYIEKCFLSILNQSIFNQIEIIFVDDCSTDESMNKIMELKNNYDNIKILKTDENSLFAGKPRNKGLDYVNSDYVLFLDSDDTLMENICEILVNKIIEHDADVVFGTHLTKSSIQDKEKNRTKHQIVPELWKYYNESEELIINDVRDCPFILKSFSVTNKLFNVNFIKENQITFPEYIPAEDSLFIFEAMINSKKTVFIPNCIHEHILTRNTAGDTSVTFRSNQATRLGRLKSYNMMHKISKQKDIENIFIENVLYEKLLYILRVNIINQKIISYDEYVELFDKGYPLFEAMTKNGIDCGKYNELFRKIVDKNYEDAIELCKTFNNELQ